MEPKKKATSKRQNTSTSTSANESETKAGSENGDTTSKPRRKRPTTLGNKLVAMLTASPAISVEKLAEKTGKKKSTITKTLQLLSRTDDGVLRRGYIVNPDAPSSFRRHLIFVETAPPVKGGLGYQEKICQKIALLFSDDGEFAEDSSVSFQKASIVMGESFDILVELVTDSDNLDVISNIVRNHLRPIPNIEMTRSAWVAQTVYQLDSGESAPSLKKDK